MEIWRGVGIEMGMRGLRTVLGMERGEAWEGVRGVRDGVGGVDGGGGGESKKLM